MADHPCLFIEENHEMQHGILPYYSVSLKTRRHPRQLPAQCHVNLSIWSKMGIRTVFTLCNASPIIGIVASLIGWPKQILTVLIMKHVT